MKWSSSMFFSVAVECEFAFFYRHSVFLANEVCYGASVSAQGHVSVQVRGNGVKRVVSLSIRDERLSGITVLFFGIRVRCEPERASLVR